MANVPAGLSRYKITAVEAELIGSQFILVEADVHLQLKGVATVSDRYAGHGEGLYFFVLKLNNECFKIYLGRTNALSRRMREYTSGFQPHSPNDFKLQAFQWYLAKSLPDAKLDLLFRPLPSEDLKRRKLRALVITALSSTRPAKRATRHAWRFRKPSRCMCTALLSSV